MSTPASRIATASPRIALGGIGLAAIGAIAASGKAIIVKLGLRHGDARLAPDDVPRTQVGDLLGGVAELGHQAARVLARHRAGAQAHGRPDRPDHRAMALIRAERGVLDG